MKILIFILALLLATYSPAQIVISGLMSNPASTNAPYEYVQLKATQSINFATTPYSVVFSTIGGSTTVSNGWASGGSITYGFNLTTGSVAQGDIFYVGGSGKLIKGVGTADISSQTWIRSINTATTAGDDNLGIANTESLGNGGNHADGVAVFLGLAGAISSSTVPIDAVFYGTATGRAATGGANAFQLPINDRYNGGKIQSCGYLFSDPSSGVYVKLTGTYDATTSMWVTKRTSTLVASPIVLSDIASAITLGTSGGGGSSGLSQGNPYNTSTILATVNGVNVYESGYGSAMAKVPGQSGYYYLMTDRGPNVDGPTNGTKIFPVKTFTPRIGKFHLNNGQLVRDAEILFKDAGGTNLNGVPNAEVPDAETAYETDGSTVIAPNSNATPRGIDSEGLAALSDGTFWVSDEYGPYLFHFAADGITTERITPFANNASGHKLPSVFQKRLRNRGMEGLTISPDGTKLVGIMQGPLENPTGTNSTSLNIRILVYTIATGVTQQYVYVRDGTGYGVNAIAAINNNEYLVIEKNGDVRIQRINLSGATDISDGTDALTGKLYSGSTIEQLSNLSANGITPVSKTNVATITSPTYPHDKAEGLVIIDNLTLAIANDDDFGITTSGSNIIQKNDATCVLDKGTFYYYTLNTVLPVDLMDFTAKAVDKKALLHWTTASEQNNALFIIEHSVNGLDFDNIGTVKGYGSTTKKTDYTFEHATPSVNINYYRLRQVDRDGKEALSAVVSVVWRDKNKDIQVFPTTVSDNRLTVVGHFDTPTDFKIVNLLGQIILRGRLNNVNDIDVHSLTSGVYILNMNNQTAKFFKQ